MSLVGIEHGSGVMVIESESSTLIDVPGAAFREIIAELNRNAEQPPHYGVQKALLSLETLFKNERDIERIEFIDESGQIGLVDSFTIARLRTAVVDQAHNEGAEAAMLTGRLLELDLAKKSLRVHTAGDDIEIIAYDDILEQVVRDALDSFVRVNVRVLGAGKQELTSLEILEAIPESRFYERQTLNSIAAEQGVSPLQNFEKLAFTDIDAVPIDDFQAFVKELRRGEDS